MITADDYDYSGRYDEGILEAVRAGAVDAVSAMPLRAAGEPQPLLESGVEVGLHLELQGMDRRNAPGAVRDQLERFRERFGRDPAFLDGHHHCHAETEARSAVAAMGRELSAPVRSVDAEHRSFLRGQGVRTQDLLLGRLYASQTAFPARLEGELPPGVTEWFVHPGYRDPDAGSSYDVAREEDLRLILSLRVAGRWLEHRSTHVEALGSPR